MTFICLIKFTYSAKLCKTSCKWAMSEIASVKLFDNIWKPLLFKCDFDPSRCQVVIFLS